MDLEPATAPGLPVALKVGGGIVIAIVAFMVIQAIVGFLFRTALVIAVIAALVYGASRLIGNQKPSA